MYLYIIRMNEYEDTHETQLFHEKIFSEQEFEAMVKESAWKVLFNIIDKFLDTDWTINDYDHDWQYKFRTGGQEIGVDLDDIIDDVKDYLCDVFGFSKPEIIVQYHSIGSFMLNEFSPIYDRFVNDERYKKYLTTPTYIKTP